MIKKILGLDLGTTSIGWAYVYEDEDYSNSEIKQIGVRVNPLTVDEQTNFEKGKPFSVNAARTLKRGMRRNLDRYKDRRRNLMNLLLEAAIINQDTILTESGQNSSYSTWAMRAKAAEERIELAEFARVLFTINKKRGYKSSRKAKTEDEGKAIDGMSIARQLYDENLTPGQWVFASMIKGHKHIPDFYRSDLLNEFDRIWHVQQKFYPEIFSDEFREEIRGKGQRATSSAFWNKFNFNTADIKDADDSLKNQYTYKFSTRELKKLQAYKWRSDAAQVQLSREEAAYVIADINNNIYNSSGYLGAISDRSKELYFNKETVGQYLYRQLKADHHTKLKNQVFYRQDYLDEFEIIWEQQARHHPQLTPQLKSKIRDTVIFYQRKLKSQKGLISFCEFEKKVVEIVIDGKKIKKTIGARVAPRSSPIFQEFKIWQNLSHLEVRRKGISKSKKSRAGLDESSGDKLMWMDFSQDVREALFEELNLKGNLKAKTILNLLDLNDEEWEINFTAIEGNHTNKALYNAYLDILDLEGYDVKELLHVKSNKDEVELDDLKVPARQIKDMVRDIFGALNINTSILEFNGEMDGGDFERQASYRLWHMLYSYEGDDSKTGNETLYRLLQEKFGFALEHAKILANVAFLEDYGSLSTKALRKIFPHIKELRYSDACGMAGYRHSENSLTREELDKRTLKPRLEPLRKNSLRQPVVEKILNQMVNVVNTLIDKENDKLEAEGKPRDFHFDEIRIELARELKKNADERAEMTTNINNAKANHDKIVKILQKEFGLINPSRNDIIRYKLFEELKNNGYKDLYSNKEIPRELLFSSAIDIEHIIPKSRLFDDSFSNKTLAFRDENLKKGEQTAYDYIESEKGEDSLNQFLLRVENMYKLGLKDREEGISKAKYQKLLKRESEIGDGFIERDLRETQYVAKKAKEMLFEITRSVISTTGSITDRLREDWGLINIMKEINLPKYRALGLTEVQERRTGQKIEVISDWTKRNDHRHHAMDALTIAFTRPSHIQYLNYLNARKNEQNKHHANIMAIEKKELEPRNGTERSGNKQFREPIPNFRHVAREHIEGILISHKSKNKVVTRNKNKVAGNSVVQIALTPRGQLHKETVYGRYRYYDNKEEAVGARMDRETILKVCKPAFREALLKRLEENDGDAKKAFSGKNAPAKNPIYINAEKTEKVPDKVLVSRLQEDYSIRKDVTPDNFKDDKLIEKILDVGIKRIMRNRLAEYGGDPKKAFSDLESNPIWLNKEKGIAIKRVTISGVNNAESLHTKKDHHGRPILDTEGNEIPVDFVSTGNNHHVAIYKDENGNLQEKVVSFYEAVSRVNQGLPAIDKEYNHDLGWSFLFTMKQNEMFVFPNEKTGFDPADIDLMDPANKKAITQNLYRVQKIATKNYMFRHHLETTVEEIAELKGITYINLRNTGALSGIQKVRLNHLGDIIALGE